MKSGKRGAIVWIAVITLAVVVLGGMMLPALCQAREPARRINCAGNLKQIGLAIIIYAGDDVEAQMLPSGDNLALLHEGGYLTDGKVYTCPSSDHPKALAADSNYVYCGAGLSAKEPHASTTVIAYDRDKNHDRWCNFLFLDGSVKGVKPKRQESVAELCRRQEWILPKHAHE